MKFGITFGQLHNAVWADAAIAADELGYESVWMPEHLVLPTTMEGELVPGEMMIVEMARPAGVVAIIVCSMAGTVPNASGRLPATGTEDPVGRA
jgi:alkanesulfonate monooxygenase SsuD/methylene tetrahydromethanopterin reductase-like flavin-dependent oxidoreductase (luciferase family)